MTTVLELLGPSTGGIRRHVATLTLGLRSRGWIVDTAGPPGVFDGLDVDLDHVVAVPGIRGRSAWLGARRALVEASAGADVIHAHGLKAGWLAALARHGRDRHCLPVVVTVHNIVLDSTGGRLAPVLRRFERALPRRTDAVIATSAEVATRVGSGQGRGRRRRPIVRVIPPMGPVPVVARGAAEVRAALGVESGRPLVVAVGRLHPQKGLPTLLDAIAFVAEKVPGVALALVGEGPDEPSLRQHAASLGLGDVVRFAGPSANAADELAAADVVAISSVWESGPLVAAEAMTLGRPLVSTPVGFVPEVVIDGHTGHLVPIGDARALAAALVDVLTDPDAAAAMGEAGRRRVAEHLDPDRLVGAVEDVYRTVLEARP